MAVSVFGRSRKGRAILGTVVASYVVTLLLTAVGPLVAGAEADPASSPSAPQSLKIESNNGTAVTLAWSSPASSGGDVITDYVVEYSIDAISWTRFADGISTATSVVVTGLTRATGYQFRVAAVNSKGVGAWRRTGAVAMDAGHQHTCSLLGDGTVSCWGANESGQLGNGTNLDSSVPTKVLGVDSATAVTTGRIHSCALLSGGTVTCWGATEYGQLGYGYNGGGSKWPIAVVGIEGAISISAGGHHTCALFADGTVQCWGNFRFQTFSNGTHASAIPVAIPGITEAIAVSAGTDHSCALVADGQVKCWGWNELGQLGGPTYDRGSDTPVLVTDISTAIAISAGASSSCAVLDDSSVVCWGANGGGQLGNGTKTDSRIPVPVTGLTGVSQVDVGPQTCALMKSGEVQCWGSAGQSGLGSDVPTYGTTPQEVSGIENVQAIAVGSWHSCALLADGAVRCWGVDQKGQLGVGYSVDALVPVDVVGIATATSITAGGLHSCALLTDRTVRCWGHNGFGQLGNGSAMDSMRPSPVEGLTDATAISAGLYHTCALISDGTIQCWGVNWHGELGNESNSDSPIPKRVAGISTAIAIAAGREHTCALLQDQSMRCWGNNGAGQLGNDRLTYVNSSPKGVSALSDVRSIAAGGSFTCAVLEDESAKCWGYNGTGQIGNGRGGFNQYALQPETVVGLAGTLTRAKTVSLGVEHSCALTKSGTVWCWGAQNSGQVGPGSQYGTFRDPAVLPDVTSVEAITTGAYHTCAIFSDGTAKCWGANENGQLGNGTIANRFEPISVSNFTDGAAISGGDNHTCAVRKNGSAKCWGSNWSGQLGNGHAAIEPTPSTPVRFFVSTASTPLAPARPQFVSRTTTSVSLQWSAPDDGGFPISDYHVEYSRDGTQWSHFDDVISSSTGATVTGLSRGTSYVFRVTAINSEGSSTRSTASEPIIPGEVASAPVAPLITGKSSTSVSLTWAAPNDGGLPIAGYKIEYSTDNTNWAIYSGGANSTTATVSGLTRGVTYRFRIAAINGQGTGAPSNASLPATPATVAAAPTAPTLTSKTANSLSIAWAAPDDGGRQITDYKIEYSADNSSWVTFNHQASAATAKTITGLNAGSSYRLRVSAINPEGIGAASTPSLSTTLIGVPSVPANLIGTWASPTSAVVSWSAPRDGGRPITDYKVEYSILGVNWTAVPHTDWASTSITIPGFLSTKSYKIRVSALNSEGFSPAANITLRSATGPGSPRDVFGVAGQGKATVTWTAPTNDGGAAITGYTVRSSPDDKTCTWRSGPLTCVVSGLTNGATYTFTVSATNFAGVGSSSEPSSAIRPRTVPLAPMGASTTLGSNLGAVSAVATDSSGSTYFSAAGKSTAFRISPMGAVSIFGSGFANAGGIAVDSAGRIYVADTGNNRVVRIALNGTTSTVGAGLKAPRGLFITSTGVLYVADSGNNRVVRISPAGLQSVVGSGFSAPSGVGLDAAGLVYIADTGNNRVVRIGASGVQTTIGSGYSNPTAISLDATGAVYVGDRSNNRVVKVTTTGVQSEIKAGFFNPTGLVVNAAGDLTVADTGNATVVRIKALPTAKAGAGQATIAWSAPSFNGGAAVTGYRVTAMGNPSKTCTTAGTTTCVVTGLTKGASYTFTIVAINEAGPSAPSAATPAITIA